MVQRNKLQSTDLVIMQRECIPLPVKLPQTCQLHQLNPHLHSV